MPNKFLEYSHKLVFASKIEFKSLNEVMHYGLPDYIIQYFGGIGDNLLCTTVARELKKRNPQARIWMITRFPELFLCNPDITHVFTQEDHWYIWHSPMLRSRRLDLAYTDAKYAGANSMDDISPSEHILAVMSRRAGIRGEIYLRPYFNLTEEEKLDGRYAEHQLTIQCIGPDSNSAMLNKLWYTNRFQTVVNKIKGEMHGNIEVLQIGSPNDPLLEGVKDLRGKTSIRKTAAILSQSKCFVGTVGFLMHLARSAECRSVIIYGGREHSWQSGYKCNGNLNSFVDCAPCWKWNGCGYDRRCLNLITVDQVISAIERIITKQETPLEVDRLVI
jgi:ADP-heptose:LPS heptosyltransferase